MEVRRCAPSAGTARGSVDLSGGPHTNLPVQVFAEALGTNGFERNMLTSIIPGVSYAAQLSVG